MRVRTIILQGGHEIKLVVDQRGGLLCKKSVGKFLLSLILSVLSVGMVGCNKVVTLPVRTVIDLTNRPIEIETGSTIDLIEKPEADGSDPRAGLAPSPEER
jgi:hypothetical protein